MENLGTYFFIALAIAFVIYYFKKKKTNAPKAKAPVKPRVAAASKPNTKKNQPKKSGQGPKKGKKASGSSPLLSAGLNDTKGSLSGLSSNLSGLDLMAELSSESLVIGDSKSNEPSKSRSTLETIPHFDLEKEVKQLQARTGWDYATANGYCEQVIQYHQKIAEPSRLKKNN